MTSLTDITITYSIHKSDDKKGAKEKSLAPF